jgi:hypothetical protein
LSTSTFSDFWLALATADFTVFSISRVAALLVNFSVINASFTFLPRMRSITRRAFWGDMRMYLLVALLIIVTSLLRRRWSRRRGNRFFLRSAAAARRCVP